MAEGDKNNSDNFQLMFTNASSHVKSISGKLTNQQLLDFYGLYKQATEGPCVKTKPGWYEITENQKWKAWCSLKNMSTREAMEKYIHLLNTIDPLWVEKKPSERSLGSWVHHSCLKNSDEVIEDSKKTIFDWVKEKNIEQVKLFGKGYTSEINKLDDNGMSLLHWAADRGDLSIVKYLVENLNADINIKDTSGQTPLHYATCCEYDDVASYLITSGADVNMTDDAGLTPYEAAM